jgi:CRP/FNR family transcriptional regulator, cyclic AMP receptor protein
METLEPILREHPFFAGLADDYLRLLTGCARNHRFEADDYLFHEGQPADEFFLIRHGKVALEVHVPGRVPMVFATLGAGEIVGASWLVPPYRWMFDARALEPTRAIGIDAACLRSKCDADHDLGYALMQCFLPAFVKRLHATRMQMFDVYGKPER